MAAPRLVTVSNRVPPPPAGGAAWPAGGLVSALLPALERRGDALWFGWSGETGDPFGALRTANARGVDYVMLDLTERQIERYYAGYCNRVLWPAMHGLDDTLAADPFEFQTYQSVNRWFAAALTPQLRRDDHIWIHDYHLIPLGRELRRLGWQGPLGYFHHTPIPVPAAWDRISHGGALLAAFDAFDLLGVQTSLDAHRLRAVLGPHGRARISVFPASIDPERFRAIAASYPHNPLHRARDDRQVMIGVDRLDYTKGILERLEAFELLLRDDPSLAERVRFVQWAAPSRSSVPAYRAYRRKVEAAAARINARFGALAPVQLDISSHPPDEVAAGLRSADISLVTSIADGMNLVAKEFAAVHSEAEPGVLILSDTCGASEQLGDALSVRSNDVASIADAIKRAIAMPVAERAMRSRRLRDTVDTATTHDWLRRFERELVAARLLVPKRPELVAS